MTELSVARPTMSIIIPAFNESRRIGQSLEEIREYAAQTGTEIEVIVVDDGSTDGTANVARSFAGAPLKVVVLTSDTNHGKGHSVKKGMLRASGELLVMCDADLSASIWEVEKLLPWARRGYGVAIGSRSMPESVLCPPQARLRRLLGGLFRKLRRLLLLPDILDTQCGLKCFCGDVARQIFPVQSIAGFAFDCEALAIARRLGHRIKEVGVVWRNNPHSRVRVLADGPRMLLSLPLILWRVRKLHRQRTSAASQPSLAARLPENADRQTVDKHSSEEAKV